MMTGCSHDDRSAIRRVGGASRMSHIQDDAVAALAVALRLTSLDLSGCLSLSDAGALPICLLIT